MLERGGSPVSWKVYEDEMAFVRPTDVAVDTTSPQDRVFVTDRILVFERR